MSWWCQGVATAHPALQWAPARKVEPRARIGTNLAFMVGACSQNGRQRLKHGRLARADQGVSR
jgi:hypothetical protein